MHTYEELQEELVSPFSHVVGMEPIEIGNGEARVKLAMRELLQNRHRNMHGGALFSLVDVTMGLACSSSHGFDQNSVTLEAKINYIRGVEAGIIICHAKVLHAGRRTLVVEADVHQDDKLVAKAQATFARV